MDPLSARDVSAATARRWDLAVVGGGIHGAALALEAARRGLATLVVERGGFGAATTAASLRIVHGGLRYLQRLDLARHRESVAERRWFLCRFPDLVSPLPCLMPLHRPPRGGRLRRPAVMELALAADARLARRRNEGVDPERALPAGRLLGPEETRKIFPGVDPAGLCGAALWHDATVSDPRRLVLEVLRWAGRCGAAALDRAEAVDLQVERGKVAGLGIVDGATGRRFEVAARAVACCAGPWGAEVARRLDPGAPALPPSVLAFNLLLDREPPSRAALALAAPGPGAQTWFLVPCEGRLLAGTAYAARPDDRGGDGRGPSEEEVAAFLGALNAAAPGLGFRREEVSEVLWGRLPAVAPGSAVPASRPAVLDHGRHGGPRGLVSVAGVKLTTARAVARRTLAALAGSGLHPSHLREIARPAPEPAAALLEGAR